MYSYDELKLYYLFIMADGKITPDEEKLYDQICKDLDVRSYEKEEVEEECREIKKSEVFETIKEMYNHSASKSVFSGHFSLFKNSYKDNARIFWNLINLGYVDLYFADEEKEIVEYLKDYWEISDDLYQEMIDIAETCLALENHKEWLNGFEESEYKEELLKQVNEDMNYVVNSLETTLSEIKE